MKAVVKTREGPGHIEFTDVERPQLSPNKVEVEIRQAAICGTDINIWHGKHRTNPPVILGHEACGVVSSVGEQVDGWKTGDRVTLETAAEIDGTCLYCKMGVYQLCINRRGLGTKRNGAFAKYCVVRPEILHHLPDNVSFEAGALSNPFAIGLRSVSTQARVKAGDIVVISGIGGIGLIALQVARLEGATVIVLGLPRDEERMALADKLGADVVINLEQQTPDEVVFDMTSGYGADVVLECAGVSASVDTCFRLVRKRGTFGAVGTFSVPIEVDFGAVVRKELRVVGSYGHEWTGMELANRLLSEGKLNGDVLISHKFPISEWQKAFEIMERGEGVRLLLHPVD
jgi:L-iditol 2-dehydrogenase